MFHNNLVLKDRKDIERVMKLHNIEIVSLCKKCGVTWGSLSEHEVILTCETCKTRRFMKHFAVLEDVYQALIKKR